MNLTDILSDVGRPVAYYKLRKITGSVTATIMLCQLFYWKNKEKDSEGWIYKTQKEMEEETDLTRWEQDGARKQLKARKLISEKKSGIPAKLHYKLNIENINKAWNEQTSLRKNHISVCGNSLNSNEENHQTITENTTEITQENTSSSFSLKKKENTPIENKSIIDYNKIKKDVIKGREKEEENVKAKITLNQRNNIIEKEKEKISKADLTLYFQATCSMLGTKCIIGSNDKITLTSIHKLFKKVGKDRLFSVIDYSVANWGFIKKKLDKGKFVLPENPSLQYIYTQYNDIEEIILEYPEGKLDISKKFKIKYV